MIVIYCFCLLNEEIAKKMFLGSLNRTHQWCCWTILAERKDDLYCRLKVCALMHSSFVQSGFLYAKTKTLKNSRFSH